MAPNPESLTVEWREDAKPLALCIVCDTEFPTPETRCPRCQSALALVHRCPKCARVVSAKHLTCPYCKEDFVKEGARRLKPLITADAVAAAQRQLINARLRGEGRRALWFSLAMFLTIFVLVTAIQRYGPAASGEVVVLGSSFVLHDVVLRQSASALSPVVARLAPPAVVEITGVQQDSQGLNWFQIKWGEGTAYVPVTALAPPKGKDAESGYTLLRTSLTDLSDPAELEDARKAVRLYRDSYPAERRGEELLWVLAEKTRELGVRTHDPRILAAARKTYQEVMQENRAHAAAAAAALAGLSGASATRSPGAAPRAGSSPGGSSSVPGAGSWGVYDDKTEARKVMLLNQTEVSVVLSAKQPLKDGEILTGQIAHAIVSNGDTVIPAGSACRVQVTAGKGPVGLSLVEIQIGGRSYPVEAAPVYLRPGQSLGRAHLLFRLRQSLMLAQ